MKRLAALCATLTLMTSCSSTPTSPAAQLAASFSEPVWSGVQGDRRAVAVLTIENVSRSDVFIGHCNDRIPVTVDRYSGGKWVNYPYPPGTCLPYGDWAPIDMAPGDRQTVSVTIEDAGVYRVSFPVDAWHPCANDPGSRCVHADGSRTVTLMMPSDPG